jgi:hypothetical protein
MAEDDARDLRLDDPEADQRMAATPSLFAYLPQLVRYPVRGYATGVTLVIGVAFWILGYSGIFGIAASGIMFGWMGFYLMKVVEETALGHAIPPPLGIDALYQTDQVRLLIIVVYVFTLVTLTAGAVRDGKTAEALLLCAAGVYLLPALVASLALQPTLLSALNPLSLLRFMYYTGWPYPVACLLLAGLGVATVLLAGHVAGAFSDICVVYGLIFICHLVGYVIYHRHEELGIAVMVQKPTDESRAREVQERRQRTLLAHIDAKLEAKEPQAAREELFAENGADLINPRLFHEELFEALRLRHQDALSLLQGTRLIQVLMREKRIHRALEICEQCLDVSADFEPQPLPLAVPLAEQALHGQRQALFERIAAGVLARHPGSDEAAALQFLKAHLLAEHRQDAAALALVEPLLAKQGHPWRARIVALHTALMGLHKKA